MRTVSELHQALIVEPLPRDVPTCGRIHDRLRAWAQARVVHEALSSRQDGHGVEGFPAHHGVDESHRGVQQMARGPMHARRDGHVEAMRAGRSHGLSIIAGSADRLAPLDGHVLHDVAQIGAFAQPPGEAAGIARPADVLGQAGKTFDQPFHEARQIAALALMKVLEVERHQHDRPMSEDVRALERARADDLHVIPGSPFRSARQMPRSAGSGASRPGRASHIAPVRFSP